MDLGLASYSKHPQSISSLSPWDVCSSNLPLEGRAQRSSGPPHLPAGSTEGEDRALREPPLPG